MLITTFFIDKFKEVSVTTPSGIQEDGGVYGDETNYSTWILGSDGDTADFEGITKTNILYGELYKITLDTGNLFNPQVRGGTPNLNGFMNMDLNDYWANIFEDKFKFNNLSYSSLIRKQGNQTIYPTLIEYANSAKQRIGWVEVNRTRASIYYEACSGGKRARSDHFYDINKFLMTSELFDTENTNQILNLSYQNVNPFTGDDERYYSNNPLSVSSFAGQRYNPFQRLSLNPIGSWFTWTNNPQGHFKSSNYVPDNIGGYLDIFPWPRGPMWNNYRGVPKYYLPALVTGNQIGLDADINLGPREIKLPIPSGIGDIVSNVPLLISQKERHLNTLLPERLANPTEFGTLSPISPVYSVDIWGEKRNPEEPNTIKIGIKSRTGTPSYGVCQIISGLENVSKPKTGELTIEDPFGLDLYELDKEYKEIYDKFKFCPPRKKIKYDLNVKPVQVQKPNNGQITKVTTGNTEEYTLPDMTRIIKIGTFNPDSKISFDGKDNNLVKDVVASVKNPPSFTNYRNLNYVDIKGKVETLTEDNTTDKDGVIDTYAVLSNELDTRKFLDVENSSTFKNNFRYEAQQSFNNELEIEYGIRNPNDFLVTNMDIPYGTYSNVIEKEILPSGIPQTTIKVMQNGSDTDPIEFKNAVSSIIKLSGNNKIVPKPTGVGSDGLPIYPKNTLEESILNLKEQLTGIKEIIFRGSEYLHGAISAPIWQDPSNVSEQFGVPKQFEYINTGITISGNVDLNSGQRFDIGNLYGHSIFQYIEGIFPKGVKSKQFFEDKEKKLIPGNIDFIGNYKEWRPYSTVKSPDLKYTLADVDYIIVSKYDTFGNKKESWASTAENPNGSPIKSTNTGTIFLESKGPNIISDTYIFNINGNVIEFDSHYKIPVKFVSSTYNEVPGYNDYQIKNMAFVLKYSPTITSKKPSDQKVQTTKQNTYGGWVFSGLYHRNGAWPKDHKFRSGLLGNYHWAPCDGAVNTGAWIKVPDARVRLEYHSFASNAIDAVSSYIHKLWLLNKNRIWEEEKPGQPSPYTLDNPYWNMKYYPDDSDKNLEDWEKVMSTRRRIMIQDLQSTSDRVLVLRLRDNNGDPSRGLTPMNITEDIVRDYWDDMNRFIFRKKGHLLEEWIWANSVVDNDSVMDNGENYYMRWYAEPTEHTQGMFKKDEWYKAVFFRTIVSPSNPDGQIAGSESFSPGTSCRELYQKKRGIYSVNEKNKKTFCDTLYVSEQILKMHRARLVEMKKYIDAKTKSVEESGSDFAKKTFFRSMTYVKALKELAKFFK